MMKKLLLLGSALFTLNFGAISQTVVTTPAGDTYTVVIDTLDYFLNKQQYKAGTSLQDAFPYYKAPAGAMTTSYGHLTHCGSVFLNSDSITVLGLSGWGFMQSNSFNSDVTVRLYLCNVDADNLPIMPPIDSAQTKIQKASGSTSYPIPLIGNLINGPKKINSNFAVLMRNMSIRAGDTVRFMRTAARTPSYAVTHEWEEMYKFGEGLGVISQGNNYKFYKTTDFNIPRFFGGAGTDYEFCVAPIVELKLVAKHIYPKNAVCVVEPVAFDNLSSPSFTNRQFNQNEFYRKWYPFWAQPQPWGFAADSSITWDFGDDLRLDTLPNTWGRVKTTVLPYGENTAWKAFDTASVDYYTQQINDFCGAFRANYKRMCSGTYGYRVNAIDSLCLAVDWCGHHPDETGIKENVLGNVKIAPNPVANGKTTISGLEGKNTITVYSVLGQLISSEVTDKETYVVDLLNQPQGAYLLRVIDSAQRSKNIRIINQKD
ncbi:MAG: T9SS type A sorting domain-containing protein [Bacteroidetes bacterium]|nr:T9SS type A sorting domain-containing protein [Bacteroidota bacterium]